MNELEKIIDCLYTICLWRHFYKSGLFMFLPEDVELESESVKKEIDIDFRQSIQFFQLSITNSQMAELLSIRNS